jgi:serine/threonine-protein kinase
MLDNRYELLEVVGTGGMAVVYKAKCHRLNRYVAVKILKEEAAADPELLRRFRDESQAVAMLSHPNIVAVYDVSKTDNLEYIVMELIDGITLKQYMTQKGGSLPWKEALHFITQIMRALRHAHGRGIIHRDIKPHNVMVLRDGSAKVADFGIAHLNNSQNTKTQEALGSVHYISPEQAKGAKVDARTDIYSAGVVLYEMLTGKLPYEGDSPVAVAIQHINSTPVPPREINPNIPQGLEQITLKAMASKPSDRYESARAMLMDLDAVRKNPAIVFPYQFPASKQAQPEEGDGDEDATQIISTTGSGQSYGKPPRTRPPRRLAYTEAEEDEEEEEERSARRDRSSRDSRSSRSRTESREKSRKATYAAIVALVLVVLFTTVGIFIFNILKGGTSDQTEHTVPNVVNMLYEEAVLRYGTEFDIQISGYEENSDVKEGMILSQDPEENEIVTGSKPTLNVVVCKQAESTLLGYMPNLENQSESVAIRTLTGMGVSEENIVKGTGVYSDTVPQGNVVSTSPAYGTALDQDTVVTYVLSLGKDPNATVTVPDLTNYTKDAAIAALKAANITLYDVTEEYNDTVDSGKVTRTSPGAGSSIAATEKVVVYISKGKEPITVPYFVGQSETVVMAQLKDLGLTGTFNKVEDSSAAGTVLSQSVSNGSQVQTGTNITFTVSSGPAESASPSPSTSTSPSTSPSTGGNVVVDKTITVNLPEQDGEVQVQVDQDGVTVYSNSVDCSRGSITISLSGSGTQDVDVYIDGALTQSMSVSFN